MSEISSGLVAVRIDTDGYPLVRLSDAEAIIAQKDAEILEQCRINGMGAEREAVLLGKVAQQAAAPTPPVSEDRWLPIETAPKDEFVLLAGPSGYTTIKTVFATGRMCSDYHVGRWIDHANDDLTDWGFEPTHWRPLPKAPAMQEDKP